MTKFCKGRLYCKECQNKMTKEYKQKNKEKIAEYKNKRINKLIFLFFLAVCCLGGRACLMSKLVH